MPPLELSDADAGEVLARGELEVLGRMPWASNATLLAMARADGVEVQAIYKPRRGERPLWDFPSGTLCQREVATYELSDALGWGLVPPTVLRDGPLGVGMVQRFVDHDPEEHYFTLLERAEWHDALCAICAFDLVANNADRKGGHCLLGDDGGVWAIDHGLCFHRDPKLRTVMWDFGGEPIPEHLLPGLSALAVEVPAGLSGLLDEDERDMIARRAAALVRLPNELVRVGRLPDPDPGYHSLPWPLV